MSKRKAKFTGIQLVSILARYEKGVKVIDICREQGISQPTFYQWQRKYSGLDFSDWRRLKEMEGELAQFKRIVAELHANTASCRMLSGFFKVIQRLDSLF